MRIIVFGIQGIGKTTKVIPDLIKRYPGFYSVEGICEIDNIPQNGIFETSQPLSELDGFAEIYIDAESYMQTLGMQ